MVNIDSTLTPVDNYTLAEIYYRILTESGIGLLQGTQIKFASMLEQLAELGDPRVVGYTRRNSSRRSNLLRTIEENYHSRDKILRLDDHLFGNGKIILTTNPWFAMLGYDDVHMFSWREAYFKVKEIVEKDPTFGTDNNMDENVDDEFPIDELTKWEESINPNKEVSDYQRLALASNRKNLLRYAKQIGIRDIFEAKQKELGVFLYLPASLREELLSALKNPDRRIALRNLVNSLRLNHPLVYENSEYINAVNLHQKLLQLPSEQYTCVVKLVYSLSSYRMPPNHILVAEDQIWNLAATLSTDIPINFVDACIKPEIFEKYRHQLQLRRKAT